LQVSDPKLFFKN